MNNLMNIKTTRELIKTVESMGYTETVKNGSSHLIFKAQGKPALSIPDHKEIARGTLRNIVKLIEGENYYQGKRG